MPSTPAKHIEFIKQVAAGISQSEAYRATSGNPKATAKTAKEQGSKLARKYAKEIQQAKEKAAAIVEAAHSSSIAKIALNEVLTVSQVDAKISKIINGELFEVQQLNNQGKVFKALISPTIADIRDAAKIFYTRFGANAPSKTQIDANVTQRTIIIDTTGNQDTQVHPETSGS